MGAKLNRRPRQARARQDPPFYGQIFLAGKTPVGPIAKMAVLRPRLQGLDSSYRESFSTAKSDLIMASPSQFRRSVRRDVEAGTSRQSGATTTPINHPEK